MSKVKFLELANRLSGLGFSTPVFGVSAQWTPPKLDVEIARRLLTFLEDKRVLYYPYEMETIDYAVKSVLSIRDRLTQEIESLNPSSSLVSSLRAMRAECRRFLDSTDSSALSRSYMSHIHIFTALGQLRGIFGYYCANIAVKYGIDVEQGLASIFPAIEEDLPPRRVGDRTRKE